jgi:hypothetical protein
MQRNPVKMSRFGPKMGRRRMITGAITASTSAPEVSGPFWDWKKAAGKSVYQESARPKTENGNSFVTSSRIVNQNGITAGPDELKSRPYQLLTKRQEI